MFINGRILDYIFKSAKAVNFGDEIVQCKEVDLNSPEFNQMFKDALTYAKVAQVSARQVQPGEEQMVVTELDATKSKAKAGDWIVVNPGGEIYTVTNEVFQNAYKPTSSDGMFTSKGVPVKAIEVNENIVFIAPWGEEAAVRAGGFIVERSDNGERYGVERQAFLDTYKLL